MGKKPPRRHGALLSLPPVSRARTGREGARIYTPCARGSVRDLTHTAMGFRLSTTTTTTGAFLKRPRAQYFRPDDLYRARARASFDCELAGCRVTTRRRRRRRCMRWAFGEFRERGIRGIWRFPCFWMLFFFVFRMVDENIRTWLREQYWVVLLLDVSGKFGFLVDFVVGYTRDRSVGETCGLDFEGNLYSRFHDRKSAAPREFVPTR